MENEKFQEFVVKHLMILSEDVKLLKGDVSSLKGDVSSLKNTVVRIETRMENEIINKIQALFNGYKQHEDRLDRLEKTIAL